MIGLTRDTMRAHRARWFVWAGGERMRHTSAMRGEWGWDVECSCGWKTTTGGAVRPHVEERLYWHRWEAQYLGELARGPLT